MRVYISGGMSGLPDFNFPAFHRAAADLRARGFEVVNPAELDAADASPKEWHEYLRRDIAQLVTCDAVCMLEGWERSKGARLERHIAIELGMQEVFLMAEAA
jgi:hypothetical protein